MAEEPDLTPVNTVVRLIGGKHKITILWLLSSHGRMRHRDLKAILMRETTPRMLSISLRELESDGLIRRSEVSPQWVEYELTSTGTSLIPLLEDLCAWGAAYQDMARQLANRRSR